LAQVMFEDARHERFGTVLRCMATLFQIITGDSWASDITWSLAAKTPQNYYAWPFMVCFVLLGSLGLLNLLTGVFIEALMEITQKNDIDAAEALVRKRKHLITLVAGAFKETDEDQGGSLDETELPEMLALCEEYQAMLDFVGLSYEKMERACKIADFDHTNRTYWECNGDDEKRVMVHDKKHRPVPDPLPEDYVQLEDGDEGVMQGELVESLEHMDETMCALDYMAIMKRLRLYEKTTQERILAVEDTIYGCHVGVADLVKEYSDNPDWTPPVAPAAENQAEAEPLRPPVTEPESVFKPELKQVQVSVPEPVPVPVPEPEPEPEPAAAQIENPQFVEETATFKRALLEELFDRYDLDGSGKMNSTQELRQLVSNLTFQIGVSNARSAEIVESARQVSETTTINWEFEHVVSWFATIGLQMED